MKVLWITNVELNLAAQSFGESVVVGGWMEQTATLLAAQSGVELFIASQSKRDYSDVVLEGIHFYSFNNLTRQLSGRIKEIIDAVDPDVVHIWGTEYIHSLETMKCLQMMQKEHHAVISIQGLISVYEKHYFANLPMEVIKHHTMKDLIDRSNIYSDWKKMKRNGQIEIETLELAKHCIGRTDWDHACSKQINPSIQYYHGDEILRKEFYTGQWEYDNCRKHTIFFSQADYPIKGFHTMLDALKIVRESYPDVSISVVGNGPKPEIKKHWVSENTYQWYLRKMIDRYGLWEQISWLGRLNAEQMKQNYLQANVFVCSSSIENSSNSIGEAMLLGVPIVASDVGGIKSLMTHQQEGILFHDGAAYMLAQGICEVFHDEEYAISLGENARQRALQTHDREKNINNLIHIYQMIK